MTVIRRRVAKPGALRRNVSRSLRSAISGVLSARGSGNQVVPPVLRPILFGGMYNCVHNNREARAFTNCMIRWDNIVGSGDATHIGYVWNAYALIASNNSFAPTGNDTTIIGAYAEYNGVTVQLTFNGNPTRRVLSGESNVRCDMVPASAFGVEKIPRGSIVAIKFIAQNDAVSQFLPASARHIASGGQVRWYNPANTTPSDISAPGVWTHTGTNPDARNNGWQPTLVARYDSDVEVWILLGDSITQGTGDTSGSGRKTGLGWPGMAFVDSDGSSNPISYYNFAVHGSTTAIAVSNDVLYDMYQYATHASVKYGTNNVGTSATPSTTVSAITSQLSTIYSNLKTKTGSRVTKIIGLTLLPRTTSTDTWLTLANQSYQSTAGWAPGGMSDQINQWIATQVGGSGLLNSSLNWVWPRDSSDPFKWITNGTTAGYACTDGTHPSTTAYSNMASEFRAARVAMAGGSIV